MNFKEMLRKAKEGEQTEMECLLTLYEPLLIRSAIVCGRFDEDLYQELRVTFLKCVQMFRME